MAPTQSPTAAYESPNQVLPRVARRAPTVRARPEVVGPDDLLTRGSFAAAAPVPTSAAAAAPVDAEALGAARERIAFLEGSLATSAKLEAAAQAYADKVEERTDAVRRAWESQRADHERQRADLEAARERDRRELVETRAALEHKERELRTLALEMGRVEGRLAAAEQRLLEAPASTARTSKGTASNGTAPDDALPLPAWWTRERAALVAGGLAFALFVALLGPGREVAAAGSEARTPVQELGSLPAGEREAFLERLFAHGADSAAVSEELFGAPLTGVELARLRAAARARWGFELGD